MKLMMCSSGIFLKTSAFNLDATFHRSYFFLSKTMGQPAL